MQVLWTAGVDEAGRGPLAGPVVCAAVILNPEQPIAGLQDSKQLSAGQRSAVREQILQRALAYSVAFVSPAEIDQLNILQATLMGMRRALEALKPAPNLALIDGNKIPNALFCSARAIVKGDQLEPCIQAASILAKTARDQHMLELAEQFPGYGFEIHKGYPTAMHLARLSALGACAIHRQSFAPVRAAQGLTPVQGVLL